MPDDGGRQVGDRGEVAGGVSDRDPAPVFAIGEVLDVMQPRLDAPVVADQALRSRLRPALPPARYCRPRPTAGH